MKTRTRPEKTKRKRDAAQFMRPVAKMYSKVAEIIRLFRVQLSLGSPYNKILRSALWDKSLILISISDRTSDTFPKRSVLCWLNPWQSSIKCSVFSTPSFDKHIGSEISQKLCRNLCSLKTLKPTLNWVSNLRPLGSKTPYVSYFWGLISLISLDSKIANETELRISGSRIFHSFMKKGKKLFLNVSVLYLKAGMQETCYKRRLVTTEYMRLKPDCLENKCLFVSKYL